MVHYKNGKLSRTLEGTVAVHSLDSCRREGTSHRTETQDTGDTNEKPLPAIQIPESLVVTAAAYREFMRKNRLHEVVEGLLEGVDVTCPEELQRSAAQIKGIIHTSPIPEPMYGRIYKACQRLGEGVILVWPVTMPYELFRCTREYQECPFLKALNPAEVIGAIKTWWASLFDVPAIQFREINRQSHREAEMTVAAQQEPLPKSRRLL